MSSRMPVVFVSHGAPDALIKAPSSVACWREIGAAMPKPKAILALSAHWEAALPTVSLSPQPETIHDFAGFARALYALQYPAPGAPDLARRVAQRFAETGMTLQTNATRGLDHGAWVPLRAMFPDADIPVTQLALPHQGDASDLLAIGTVLRPLRDEGVLFIASGAITHNFGWLSWGEEESPHPLPRAKAFADSDTRDHMIWQLTERGIAQERLAMLPWAPEGTRWEVFASIDLALDTFPYNQATNTCEALWMGVPTLTCAGGTHQARMGASILHSAGLDDFVAPTSEQWVQLATTWASDAHRLSLLRSSMRDRLRCSPLFDTCGLVREIEAFYSDVAKR